MRIIRIILIIRINGASRVVACRLAGACARTLVPLSGMVCTDTPGSRSRMTHVHACPCACAHAHALVRVLVWSRMYVPLLSRSEMRITLSPS
jgi:hypothetical protein